MRWWWQCNRTTIEKKYEEKYTNCKISWGGIHRKDTKGLDQEYYDNLMSKLIIDETAYSGYRMISSNPYVYPELKDSLYEE